MDRESDEMCPAHRCCSSCGLYSILRYSICSYIRRQETNIRYIVRTMPGSKPPSQTPRKNRIAIKPEKFWMRPVSVVTVPHTATSSGSQRLGFILRTTQLEAASTARNDVGRWHGQSDDGNSRDKTERDIRSSTRMYLCNNISGADQQRLVTVWHQ